MLRVLNPTEGPATGRVVLAPRLSTLIGKVVGVLWNGRPLGDQVLKLVVEELQHKYELRSAVFTTKLHDHNIAPEETFDELAASCDAVITGVGDTGTNCSAAVLDALTMEKRGIPAVCIGVETLVMTGGRGMAMAHGVPDYPIAGFRHKLGQEEIRELVAEAIPQVIKALCV